MLKNGMVLADRYEILQQIGIGGMAYVYRAKDLKLNRFVAIKVLKEEFCKDKTFVSKFQMEAQAAAGMSHANIVGVYDVGEEGSTYYIVMELIEGITLKEYIIRKHKLGIKETIGVAIQVAQGLEAAHARHLIHRDIKPQNIIISRDGKIKVTDFGIARAITDETTNMYKAAGSVHYISPEQARGGYCDERSDIYSLGITMYEMACGRVPFDGETTVAVAIAHMNEAPVSPSRIESSIPLALEQIILKCIQKKPENRYDSCASLIRDLRQAIVTPQTDFIRHSATEEPAASDTSLFQNNAESAVTKNTIQITPMIKQDLQREAAGRVESERQAPPRERSPRRDQRPREPQRQRQERQEPPQPTDPKDLPATAADKVILAIGSTLGIVILFLVVYFGVNLYDVLKPHPSDAATLTPVQTTAAVTEEQSTTETEPVTTMLAEEGVTMAENQTIVPNLLGHTLDEAKQLLEDAGLVYKASNSYDYSDEYGAGTICKQQYSSDTIVKKGTTVRVTLSMGSDKLDFDGTEYIGKSRSVLEYLLNSYSGILVTYTEVEDNTAKNTILAIEPESGLLAPGDTLTVYYSSGPRTVAVPSLYSLTREQANSRLENNNLHLGKVTETYNEEYDAGTVCWQSVNADTVVNVDTYIDIYVSLGPAPVAVPSVWGLTEYEATLRLQNAGLSVNPQYQYNSAEKGTVFSQDPAAETYLTKWSAVTIYISLGQQPLDIGVESVTNMTQDEAINYVTSLGLNYVLAYEQNQWVAAGLATRLDLPNWGQNGVFPGDTVTIYISTGQPQADNSWQNWQTTEAVIDGGQIQ